MPSSNLMIKIAIEWHYTLAYFEVLSKKTHKICFFFVNLSADVCQFHSVLEDYDRDINYQTPLGDEKGDNNLNSGWYRFLNISGITMPTTCPPPYTCGTISPGWLTGDHPTVEDGEVSRRVCYARHSSRCCHYSYNIRVRNCTSFYVYLLISTRYNCRFCFTYN